MQVKSGEAGSFLFLAFAVNHPCKEAPDAEIVECLLWCLLFEAVMRNVVKDINSPKQQ